MDTLTSPAMMCRDVIPLDMMQLMTQKLFAMPRELKVDELGQSTMKIKDLRSIESFVAVWTGFDRLVNLEWHGRSPEGHERWCDAVLNDIKSPPRYPQEYVLNKDVQKTKEFLEFMLDSVENLRVSDAFGYESF